MVYLPDQKIAATGDIIAANRADDNPNIHMDKNGSAEGWIDKRQGHCWTQRRRVRARAGDRADEGRHSAEAECGDRAAREDCGHGEEGKSLEEIKGALPDTPAPGARAAAPPLPARLRWPGPAPGFVDAVYAELTKKS